MAYKKQIWVNNSADTPLSADRLNHIEDGIFGNSDDIVTAQSDISTLTTFKNNITNATNITKQIYSGNAITECNISNFYKYGTISLLGYLYGSSASPNHIILTFNPGIFKDLPSDQQYVDFWCIVGWNDTHGGTGNGHYITVS